MKRRFKVIAAAVITASLLLLVLILNGNNQSNIKGTTTTIKGSKEPQEVVEIDVEYNQAIEELLEYEYDIEINRTLNDEVGSFFLAGEGEDGNIAFIINKVDTIAPTLPKIENITLPYAGAYSASEQVSSIQDELDGSLPITYEGNVNPYRAGEYIINYSTKDNSGNTAQAQYTVTVKEKVVTQQIVTTAGSAYRDNNTIYLERLGRLIYYSNGSSDVNAVQSALDSSPSLAKIYSIVGGNYHSGSDGATTYFTGHEYSAFSSISSLGYGDVISVKVDDVISSYVVSDIFTVTAVVNDSGTRNVPQSFMDKINSVAYSETIILQTCIQGAPNEVLIVIASLQ